MDLEQMASRLYGGMSAATPAPPAAPPLPSAPAQQEAPPPATDSSDPGAAFSDTADALFPTMVPTNGYVDWNEPPAQPAEYELAEPEGTEFRDYTPEGQAAEQRFRMALAEVGIGRTAAEEFWKDALAAQHRPAPTSRDMAAAERELRAAWGNRYEAKIGAARALVQQVARTSPEALEYLNRTGLGNDPAFIRKVVAWAEARQKRGTA